MEQAYCDECKRAYVIEGDGLVPVTPAPSPAEAPTSRKVHSFAVAAVVVAALLGAALWLALR